MVWCAVKRVRRKEELHALDIPGRCAIALVHVAATNPFRAGRHTYLIPLSVVADGSAGSMGSMEVIVARLLRIVSARVPDTVVNGIVPVVIMIRVHPVPTAVVGLQRIMRPALASVRAGNDNVLPGVTEGPDLRCVGVLDSWLNGVWSLGLHRSVGSR